VADVDALERYWKVCPHLRPALFKPNRTGYVELAVEKAAIKATIYQHPEFTAFITGMNAHFAAWRKKSAATLKALTAGSHPKQVIVELAEDLLAHYKGKPLIDAYDDIVLCPDGAGSYHVGEIIGDYYYVAGTDLPHRRKVTWLDVVIAKVAMTIRLNTELAKKPKECLEYIVVHEMTHLLEPTHNARFLALMDQFMPNWRLRRDHLNQLPVRHEEWAY
jgi:hypothetical protein